MGGRAARRFAASTIALAVLLATTTTPGAHARAGRSRAAAGATFAAPADTDSSAVAELQREAARLAPLVRTPWVRAFLAATAQLPHVATRAVYTDSARTRWWTAGEAGTLPDSTRARLVRRELDEGFYYDTRYGSPLAYARPLDLLAAAGVRDPRGLRLCDFGYGTVGHLRLLASLGADVTGIEVDPLLPALYSAPADTGAIGGGHVRLVSGHWPGDADVAAAVGGGYDVFVSKNTLKNGYIHPERPTDPRRLVHLGVDDTTFVAAVARIVKPGGWAVIYNLSPAPAPPDKPYIPWADGRCPFPSGLWRAHGFDVVDFDRVDDAAARAMGHALGWDQGAGAMDLAHDLFAHVTLLRRRAR